jgi:hypothetical protein
VKDPYWLIKSRSYILDIPIFGEKAYLQQNIELLLFLSSSLDSPKSISSSTDARMKAHFDLFEKKYGRVEMSDKNGKLIITSVESYYMHLPGYKQNVPPIYTYIPELKLMKKNLSYPEIYTSLSRLADPYLVFVNMFKQEPVNNLLTGLVYFPYTPKLIQDLSVAPSFLVNLASYLKLNLQ